METQCGGALFWIVTRKFRKKVIYTGEEIHFFPNSVSSNFRVGRNFSTCFELLRIGNLLANIYDSISILKP